MKKFLAMLLAAMLCLSLASFAVAEDAAADAEATVPEVEAPVTFEATPIEFTNLAIGIQMPKDWLANEVTEEQAAQGLLMNVADPGVTVNLQIVAQSDGKSDLDALWETLTSTEGVENVAEGYINGLYFITYDVPSTNSTSAVYQLSEEDFSYLYFTFVAPEGTPVDDAMKALGTVPYEIIGSIYDL